METEPVEWVNGNGDRRWQPRCGDTYYVWWYNQAGFAHKEWSENKRSRVMYRSYKRAKRIGRREAKSRARRIWSEFHEG